MIVLIDIDSFCIFQLESKANPSNHIPLFRSS
nr:MAG TPA: hypothetical protein [Caudoviricetes sp.]